MVQIAIASGRTASERLFVDWQEAGLIDQPEKKGLGRGKGIVARWPESQLRLWLLLLDKRRETTQVPNLCNIPVGLWLYFGDEYASLRQVRRSMKTWASRYGSSRGHKLAKQTARKLLEDLPLGGDTSKNFKADLVSATANMLLHGIAQDAERRQVREQLLAAVGVKAGETMPPSRAGAMVEMVLVRLLAAHHLTVGVVPDHIFQWARAWHLFGLRSYMQALSTGNLPQMVGVEFDRPDFEQLIPSACRDVMSVVGMALGLEKGEALPAPFYHPDAWRDGPVDVTVSSQIRPSPIVLPNGRRHATLQINVTGQAPNAANLPPGAPLPAPSPDGDSLDR